ncbi:MAG: enoyl-CoA hydratase/isomerase family protein [Bacillota bacterium]
MYTCTEVNGAIGILGLNRPRTNSLNFEFLNEIYHNLSKLDEQESIKSIILRSELDFGFSSGLDLSSFYTNQRVNSMAENIYQAVRIVYKINKKILLSDKLYIAVLKGPVIGSAASIAFSCDLRIACKSTWFWLPDVQFGGVMAEGGIEVLNKLVGKSRAAMLLYTNERINLDKAQEWGLIYKTEAVSKIDESAFLIAERQSKYSSNSISMTKRILNRNMLKSFDDKELRKILFSEDTRQRMIRHFEKNKL